MAFDLVTFTDSLVNLIDKNNTTTSSYDISGSLKTRVRKVSFGFYKNKPLPNILYPCVWVSPVKKANEFVELGRSAKRKQVIEYEIAAITNEGIGYENGREVADQEMLQLSSNLETLFRNYPRLSVTAQVMQSQISDISYDVSEYNETWNSMSLLKLIVDIFSV
jgi:hypothetical protein